MIRSRVTFATIEAAAIAALFSSPSMTAWCGGAAGPPLRRSARRAVGRTAGASGRCGAPPAEDSAGPGRGPCRLRAGTVLRVLHPPLGEVAAASVRVEADHPEVAVGLRRFAVPRRPLDDRELAVGRERLPGELRLPRLV